MANTRGRGRGQQAQRNVNNSLNLQLHAHLAHTHTHTHSAMRVMFAECVWANIPRALFVFILECISQIRVIHIRVRMAATPPSRPILHPFLGSRKSGSDAI